MPEGIVGDKDDDEARLEEEKRRRLDPDWRVHEIDLLSPAPVETVEVESLSSSNKSLMQNVLPPSKAAASTAEVKKKKKKSEQKGDETRSKKPGKKSASNANEDELAIQITRKPKKKRTPMIAAPATPSSSKVPPSLPTNAANSNGGAYEPINSSLGVPDAVVSIVPEKVKEIVKEGCKRVVSFCTCCTKESV